ncbi:uncharacterized protein ACA1_031580 [Acanthamoeba castellanii str. Neff]|uniref:Uncharacterized protein n=1 Tax=Acanthamoeba castellanii (strain ATCC 30010 / Neff) TaxID=1257118 RepID=L8GSI1_ACACF|nr:uncharacterized protein ACA1_031580 [Acanthamoeba castellanii str. Neff]ELR15960.1 hypothetical protein ACA1_031580 [Acanthamoeba castellanii str. Neff]
MQQQVLAQEEQDPASRPSASAPAGDQAQGGELIASEIAAELTYLRRQREKYGRNEVRITNVGPSKAGKTTFVAALQDEEVTVPPHLGAGNHHGTHWVCQDSYTTTLLGQELRVVSQDLKGITYDAAESRTMEEIAEEVGNIYVGVFPSELLQVPHEASRRQGEIEQEPQDTLLLVFGANLLNEKNALHCLATIAKNLARKHLPYFIALTKVDLLPEETTVEAAIQKVEEATGTNRAFIFSIANTIKDRQKLPPQTTLQILRLYSAILRHTRGRLGPAPWTRRAAVGRVGRGGEEGSQEAGATK